MALGVAEKTIMTARGGGIYGAVGKSQREGGEGGIGEKFSNFRRRRRTEVCVRRCRGGENQKPNFDFCVGMNPVNWHSTMAPVMYLYE